MNRGLPVLDKGRALDPCRRSEGSWALGTRMVNDVMSANEMHGVYVGFVKDQINQK